MSVYYADLVYATADVSAHANGVEVAADIELRITTPGVVDGTVFGEDQEGGEDNERGGR